MATERIPNMAIMAAAGTGKTYRLSRRYIALLAKGEDPAEILALTFTKAAASEMLERILKELAEAAIRPEKARELSSDKEVGRSLVCSDFARLLDTMLKKLPKLRISTYDSLFYEIARCYSVDLGLKPSLEIMGDDRQQRMREEALRDFLQLYRGKAGLARLYGCLADLDKDNEIRQVSRTVLERIAEIENAAPDSADQVWGNVKIDTGCPAKDEKPPVIKTSLDPASKKGKTVQTLNNDLELAWAGKKNLADNTIVKKLYNGHSWNFEEADLVLDEYGLDSDSQAALIRAIKALGRENLAARNSETKTAHGMLKDFQAALDRRKKGEGLFTFDDITRAVRNTVSRDALELRASETGLYIYFRLDSRIKHLLIDEFQDTSWEQWLIMQPIVDELISDSEDRSVFVVGDAKQSIYGWRGGRLEIFLNMQKHYESQLAKENLVESYRSCPQVLNFVNAVFNQREFAGWRQMVDFKDHVPSGKTKDIKGFAQVRTLRKKPDDGPTGKERLWQEAAEILLETKPYKRGQTAAVLVRRNSHAAKVRQELLSRGIPCAVDAKIHVGDYQETGIMLALFKALSSPGDSVARTLLRESPLAPALAVEKDEDESLAFWRRQILREGYGAAARRLAALWDGPAPEARHLADFVAAAESFKTRDPGDVRSFLGYMESYTRPKEEGDASQVAISTIHSAKGLTYEMVIYVVEEMKMDDISDDKFVAVESKSEDLEPPVCQGVVRSCNKLATAASRELVDMTEKAARRQILENSNLVYVALTRAAKAVYVVTYDAEKEDKGKVTPASANQLRNWLKFLPGQEVRDMEKKTDYGCFSCYEEGERNWFEAYPLKEAEKEAEKEAALPAPEFSREITRHRQTVSPSKLGKQPGEAEETALSQSGARREGAMLRGTAVHMACSLVEWSDCLPGNLKEELLRRLPELEEDLAAQAADLVLKCAASPEVLVFQRPAEDCEVRREMPFECLQEGRLLKGTMDRVHFFPNARNPRRIVVYDFKTGHEHEENKVQIEAYVKVLKESYRLEDVEGQLVYLEGR